MRHKRILALSTAFLLLLTGCSHTPSQDVDIIPDSNSDTQTNSLPEPSVTYTYHTEDVLSDDGKTTLIFASYMKPSFHLENEAATTQMQATFEELQNSYLAYFNSYKEEAEAMYDEYTSDFTSYAIDFTFSNQRDDEKIISAQQTLYLYSGGPHGNNLCNGLNFDKTTGKILTLDTIASDKETLLNSLRSYIAELLQLPQYRERLFDEPEAMLDEIDSYVLLDENWYFTKTGITFTADPYVLGSYAAGFFYFDIPYEFIQGLKEEFLPSTPYMLAMPVGGTITKDLNGDGQIDTCLYDNSFSSDYTSQNISLSINGTDFSSILQSEEVYLSEGSSAYMVNNFYLVDLDTSDKYLELAFLDCGPSDDPISYFYRYDGSNLTFLGSVNNLVSDNHFYVNGNGTFFAGMYLNLMETRTITVLYQLDEDGKISPAPVDFYDMKDIYSSIQYTEHQVLQEVLVHENPSRSSACITLTPEDGPVTFRATDNQCWIELQTADEHTYYLYMLDFSTTEDHQDTMEVFENLRIAG